MLDLRRSSTRVARRFQKDDRGAIIVWFAITLPVVLGMFALSLDLGRYMEMHTELKNIADAASLAAAKALDNSDTAIQKADAAAAAVINNSKFADSWAGGGATVTLVYAADYASLAKGAYLAKGVASDERKATFVQAITNTGTVTGLFIRVLNSDTEMAASVRSTAASHTVACAVQPLFMCLPSGGKTLTPGTMVQVKEQPGNAWGPGNFGLLDPPYSSLGSNQKNRMIKKNLAQSSPDTCYINALSPAQGSKAGSVREGLNARFDVFDNNPDDVVRIPPGPNNFKGDLPLANKNSQCVKTPFSWTAPPPEGRMPRDSCFPDGCGGPYGNGDWQAGAAKYWSKHYTTAYPGFPTRFAMYMAELGLDTSGNSTGTKPTANATDPEKGRMGPVCAAENKINGTGTWERRVIYAAMIDCQANLDWLTGNSTKSPIQNADIGQFFMTEPTEQGQEIYLEFVKRITKNDDAGKLHAIVQLYPNPQDQN